MSRRANTTVIGLFVISSIALVLGAVTLFGTGRFFHDRVVVVTAFEGSVTGLQVGSPVEFRGVPIGTVTSIRAVYDSDKASFVIPVYMSLDSDYVSNIRGDASRRSPREVIERMIESGLRSRLDIRSIVTGTKFVALDFYPDEQARVSGIDGGIPEIPSTASRLEKVTTMFDKLDIDQLTAKAILAIDGINTLVNSPALASAIENLDEAAGNASTLLAQLKSDSRELSQSAVSTLEQTRETLAVAERALTATLADLSTLSNSTDERLERVANELDTTLAAVRTLADNIDRQVMPLASSARSTLDQATFTLKATESLIAEDSHTRYNLDRTLEELAAAARSVRLMADYLEQNPDALLKGKGQ